jgi:hypothetical protein
MGRAFSLFRSFVAVIAFLLSISTQALAAAPTAMVKSQMSKEETLNDKCRDGGARDQREFEQTEKICNQRDQVLSELKREGWCWGNANQYEYQKNWQRCKDAASDTVHFDPHASIRNAQLRQMKANASACFHTAFRGLLMRGEQRRSRLLAFAESTCGSGMKRFLVDQGTPPKVAAAFVAKEASEELDFILQTEN